MPAVVVRSAARREILRQFEYIADRAGIGTARRFLSAVQETSDVLAQHPRLGPRCGFTRSATRRLRRWPVEGFENRLHFYQPRGDGVEIVHLLHGARDIDAILGP